MIITIILNNETIPLPEMQMDVGVDWCFGRSDASPGNTQTHCNTNTNTNTNAMSDSDQQEILKYF